MSLLLSDEQLELKNTLRRFFADKISSEYLRTRIGSESGSDDRLWRELLELGITASFASEEDGGAGLKFKELAIAAFEAGYALVPENLVEGLLCGPYLLSNLTDDKCREFLKGKESPISLSRIVEGTDKAAWIAVSEMKVNSRKEVSGAFRLAAGVKEAKAVVFSVGEKIFSAFLSKDPDLQEEKVFDLTLKRYRGTFKGLSCRELSGVSAGYLSELLQVLHASEMAGIAAKVVSMTVEYVKTRKQFGVPVGSFQAVKHRLADMYMHAEAIRALSNFAAWAADNSHEQLSLAAKSAIRYACDHCSKIVEGAIQLHGGIGFTWEYDLHLYLRRAKTLEALHQ